MIFFGEHLPPAVRTQARPKRAPAFLADSTIPSMATTATTSKFTTTPSGATPTPPPKCATNLATIGKASISPRFFRP